MAFLNNLSSMSFFKKSEFMLKFPRGLKGKVQIWTQNLDLFPVDYHSRPCSKLQTEIESPYPRQRGLSTKKVFLGKYDTLLCLLTNLAINNALEYDTTGAITYLSYFSRRCLDGVCRMARFSI